MHFFLHETLCVLVHWLTNEFTTNILLQCSDVIFKGFHSTVYHILNLIVPIIPFVLSYINHMHLHLPHNVVFSTVV